MIENTNSNVAKAGYNKRTINIEIPLKLSRVDIPKVNEVIIIKKIDSGCYSCSD